MNHRPRPAPSLRLRVTLAGACAVALLAAGLALISSLRLEAHAADELDRLMRVEMDECVKHYRQQAGAASALDLGAAERAIAEEAGEIDLVLRDATGAVLAHSQGLAVEEVPFGEAQAGDFSSTPLGPGLRFLTADLRAERLPFGFVQGIVSRAGTNHILADYRRSLLLALPLAVLAGALAIWLLAGRALRPLGAMADAAEAIGPEDLSGRLPPAGTGDDLERITLVLNRMLDRLQEAFQQLQTFTADVSHELRTPLTILRGAQETALTHADPAVRQSALEGAIAELDRMTRLIDGLLALTRLGAGATVDDVSIEAAPWVSEVLEDAQAMAEERGVLLRYAPLPAVTLRGHRTLLRQALWNLLVNAVHVSLPGGVIELTMEQGQDRVRIAIRDAGPGIAPEFHERIFEPFFRIPDGRAQGHDGLGLGLALTQRIIRRHGGRITLESRPGAGACFTIELPLA